MILPQDDFEFFENIAKGWVNVARISEIHYQYNKRELVYQHNKVKLYHYHPKSKNPRTAPVLVVFATVNRPEILDLFPDHSFIRGLLDNGLDVYLLDWGYPDANDQSISVAQYVAEYMQSCVQFIIESSHHEKINLLGICQGGVLCLCYSILFNTIKNLILISTPVDFHTDENIIGKMFQRFDVDAFTRLTGNIPGLWLTNFFISLRPFELVGKKYLRFVDHIDDDNSTNNFLRVEKWLYDAPDQTMKSFTELIKDFYQKNKLIKNEIYLGNHQIDLSQLKIPVLNIMAEQDEIVPVSATRVLKQYIGSKDYSEIFFPSGHIGIYISDKVGKAMPKAISNWLKKSP